MAIASLNHLSYWYPNQSEPALSDVTLELDGGLTLVAGPSGGGKSTLLRVLNGLVPHFHGGRIAGDALVDGMSIVATPTRRLARSVGFVFQDPELQTVYDVVEREVGFGLENIGLPAGEIPKRVAEAVGEAGIDHLAGRSIRTLSGGERQRVALASALVMRPRLVVLDEPTSQLDPDGAAMVLAAVTSLAAGGHAVVMSEHRVESTAPHADRIVAVDRGTVSVIAPNGWKPSVTAVAPPRTASPGPVAWSLDRVTAGFGAHLVLDQVSLAGRQGEVVALSGRNGGGKTTLLRLIAGGVAPLQGTIERRPGRIAYLPQNPTALLHRPTLLSEVVLTLERAGEAEPPASILEALGLKELAGRYPRDLSCGERQRAALAAVLPGRPALVLLDEPTRGMDVAARDALIALIARLRDAGSAIVLATHDTSLREAVADRVFDVSDGRVNEVAHQVVAS